MFYSLLGSVIACRTQVLYRVSSNNVTIRSLFLSCQNPALQIWGINKPFVQDIQSFFLVPFFTEWKFSPQRWVNSIFFFSNTVLRDLGVILYRSTYFPVEKKAISPHIERIKRFINTEYIFILCSTVVTYVFLRIQCTLFTMHKLHHWAWCEGNGWEKEETRLCRWKCKMCDERMVKKMICVPVTFIISANLFLE